MSQAVLVLQTPISRTMIDLDKQTQAIQKCQSGELAEFAVLYDAYSDSIYKFIYYRIQDRYRAEDLTSEIFFKALKKIDHYNPDLAQFSTWLYQIARNHLVDHYRTFKALDELDEAIEISTSEDIPAELDKSYDAVKVRGAMEKLPLAMKEIIVMRMWEDLSYNEIAERTGKSEAALKMHMSRAMKKLAEILNTTPQLS